MAAPVVSTKAVTLAAGVNLIQAGALGVQSIQVFDTSGATNTIDFYDNDSGTVLTRNLPGYTGRTVAAATITVSYTDVYGKSVSFTYPGQTSVSATRAAQPTAAARLIWKVVLPANTSAQITFDEPQGASFGVNANATGAARVVFGYKLANP